MKRLLLSLSLGLMAAPVAADPVDTVRVSAFSGKPVPRFETLKYHKVNGRQGPTMEHKVLWSYERKGLPVLVVRETENWRRVRDPDGDEVWMHRRVLEPSLTALTQTDIPLRKRPDPTSTPRALLSADLVVAVESCKNGWCRISAQTHDGYVLESELWGINRHETGL